MKARRSAGLLGMMILGMVILSQEVPGIDESMSAIDNNEGSNPSFSKRATLDCRIEGEIVETLYNYEGATRKRRKYRFVAYVHEPYWRIRTIPLEANNRAPRVKYHEVGTDGTNSYQVTVLNPEYDRKSGQKKALSYLDEELKHAESIEQIRSLKRKKAQLEENIEGRMEEPINGAIGKVNPFPYPEGDPDLIAPVWLAYCSRHFFRDISTKRAPKVWTHATREKEYPKNKVAASIERFDTVPRLPKVVRFHSGGYHYTRDGRETARKRLAPPFRDGYTNAIYKVVEVAEETSVNVPEIFELRQYKRRQDAEDINDVWLVREVRGELEKYEVPCRTNRFVPNLPARTAVQDKRASVGGGERGIQYIAAPGSWNRSTNVASLTAFHQKLRGDGRAKWRGIVMLLLGAVTLLPLAFLGFRGLRRSRIPRK